MSRWLPSDAALCYQTNVCANPESFSVQMLITDR